MKTGYNFQKISQYINGLQRQINQIRQLGKKLSRNSESSQQHVNKIMEEKNQINPKIKDPSFKKQLNHLDYLLIEKQQSQANILWIKGHLENWIQVSKQLPRLLQEQAKKLESKRVNNILKQQQITVFKAELLAKTIEHKKSMRDLFRTLGQWNVKNCCGLIQNLTTIMQSMKTAQKRRGEKSTRIQVQQISQNKKQKQKNK